MWQNQQVNCPAAATTRDACTACHPHKLLAHLPEQLHQMASKCAAAAAAIQLMQAKELSASAAGISRMHVLPVEYLQVEHIPSPHWHPLSTL